jgi:hypothetical protein
MTSTIAKAAVRACVAASSGESPCAAHPGKLGTLATQHLSAL